MTFHSRWGQHIVLLLSGQRNTIRHSLFIEFTATRKNATWQGVALIPTDFLPPNVTKMNAYAIHGSDQNRVYESLYPVAFNSTNGADLYYLVYYHSRVADFIVIFLCLFLNDPSVTTLLRSNHLIVPLS